MKRCSNRSSVHLADFEKSQKSKNNSPSYVMEIMGKIRRFVDSVQLETYRPDQGH